MAWADVELAIRWWDSTVAWGPGANPAPGYAVSEFSAGEKEDIRAYLEAMYTSSPAAASILEGTLLTEGTIRFAKSQPALPAGVVGASPPYLVLNLDALSQVYYINDEGALVQEIPALAIIHEIIHYGLDAEDTADLNADGFVTEYELNSEDYDHVGDTLRIQDDVVDEMGWIGNHQISYQAAVRNGTGGARDEFDALQTNVGYTDGLDFDIARIGTLYGDSVDHSNNNVELRDLILAIDGDDTVSTGAGRDFIYGGRGSDTVDAGDGDDYLIGEEDDDSLAGGDGDDLFRYYGQHGGFDIIDGGDGADKIEATADYTVIGLKQVQNIESITGSGFTGVYVQGSDGADTIDFAGATVIDIDQVLLGGGGDAYLGSAGVDIVHGEDGNDSIYGGLGNDLIYGSAGDDGLFGDDGDDLLDGDDGNDALKGGGGVDFLLGGDGDDILTGGAGADTYDGGLGNDTVFINVGDISADGGDGWDELSLEDVSAALTGTITTTTSTLVGVDFLNIEAFKLTDLSDTVNAIGTYVFGADGDDILTGGIGGASLYGDDGNDVLTAGGVGIDLEVLSGGEGNDTYNLGQNTIAWDAEGANTFNIGAGSGYSTNKIDITIDGLELEALEINGSAADIELFGGAIEPDIITFGGVAITSLTIKKSLGFYIDGFSDERSFYMGETNNGYFFIESYFTFFETEVENEFLKKPELLLNFTGDISAAWTDTNIDAQSQLDLMQGSILGSVYIDAWWEEAGISVTSESAWGTEHDSYILGGTPFYIETYF